MVLKNVNFDSTSVKINFQMLFLSTIAQIHFTRTVHTPNVCVVPSSAKLDVVYWVGTFPRILVEIKDRHGVQQFLLKYAMEAFDTGWQRLLDRKYKIST